MVAMNGKGMIEDPRIPDDPQDSARPALVRVAKSDLVRAAHMLNTVLDRMELEEIEPSQGKKSTVPEEISPAEHFRLLDMARRLIASRKARARFFANAMFGEPPWDILLSLYVSDNIRESVTINRVAELASVPATSAKRWLEYLEREQLIIRRPHPTDLRMSIVELTARSRRLLNNYLRHLMGMQNRAPAD